MMCKFIVKLVGKALQAGSWPDKFARELVRLYASLNPDREPE